MARIGNNGNHGKKGCSGRKTAYREKADAIRLHELLAEKMKQSDAEKRLATGNLDLLEAFVLRGRVSTRVACKLLDLLFPHGIKVEDTEPKHEYAKNKTTTL